MLGCFLNTLPIRAQLEGTHSFREVLGQVRETLWTAFRHADLPFEQMVEMAVQDRKPGQQPLYQAMFVLVEEGPVTACLAGAKILALAVHSGSSKNDLTLSLRAAGESWDCQFEYATDLFEAETIERMAQHLIELLSSITADPAQPIGKLRLISDAERHQLLVEWNQTAAETIRTTNVCRSCLQPRWTAPRKRWRLNSKRLN